MTRTQLYLALDAILTLAESQIGANEQYHMSQLQGLVLSRLADYGPVSYPSFLHDQKAACEALAKSEELFGELEEDSNE